jgi:hypothetical protein
MSVTTSIYNCLKYDMMTKAVSLSGDTINCALFTSSATFTATDTTYGTTNELATANGYTQGGAALAGKAVTGTTTQAWTANATAWTATGAGFTARVAKLYSSTNSSRLIAHVDFGEDKTASGGGTFTITWDVTGIFTVA